MEDNLYQILILEIKKTQSIDWALHYFDTIVHLGFEASFASGGLVSTVGEFSSLK